MNCHLKKSTPFTDEMGVNATRSCEIAAEAAAATPTMANAQRCALTRREWIGTMPATIALVAGATALAADEPEAATTKPRIYAEFPAQDPALVRDVVGASHVRIDRVRELVEASPALAKATWDWGFGDWESALGAASHMGRRDIAELLMAHGARPDLFTFAMMGNLEVVRSYVEARPGIQRIPGPHGITLLQHARHGQEHKGNSAEARDNAQRVAEYLESLGDADVEATSLAISDEQKQLYLGRYVFGDGDDEYFEVLTNRQGTLAIQRGERIKRMLNRVEEHVFAPGGAPAVRVRFKVEAGRSVSVTVHDPIPLVTAVRQP